MSEVDFDRVEAVVSRLGAVADSQGIGALTDNERIVLLVSWAKGLVDNGGFNYFYEGASNAREVAGAFRALGLNELAEAFDQSTSAFPEGVPPQDHLVRREWITRHGEQVEGFFETLNSTVWACDDTRICHALQHFIESNRIV